MGRKMQYCQENDSSPLDLQIQCNPNQNISKLFSGCHKSDSRIYMEKQKNQNSQQSWERETTQL